MTDHDGSRHSEQFVAELLQRVAYAPFDRGYLQRVVDLLGEAEPSVVAAEIERMAHARVAAAWNAGWQPNELARQLRRGADADSAKLALVTIGVDHADRDASTLDARWAAQLAELDLPQVASGPGWLARWARAEELTWPAALRSGITLLRGLATISPLPILIPPPGARRGPVSIIDLTPSVDDPMLNRVRALLAQAESTNFEAEAETFTAKAQELMTRHAIDMAMVSASSRRSEQPITIRVPVDEPYVDAKSLLLQLVAESSRCRAVFHPRFAMSSVIGFAGDLTATQTLFTSLLVQAQVAMQATATSAPPGTRTRSRSFRSAFLNAYAHRIAERLAEVNARVMADAEAETGRSILPVLAARSSCVDETVGEMFGRLRSSGSRRGFDAEGWASGRRAADRARLNSGDLPAASPSLAERG